jgi:histidyl-tRNA synthetase
VFSETNLKAKSSLNELKVLGRYLQHFGVYANVMLDTSLARGLDYYTGVIFEGVCLDPLI